MAIMYSVEIIKLAIRITKSVSQNPGNSAGANLNYFGEH